MSGTLNAKIRTVDLRILDKVFAMEGGYVLDSQIGPSLPSVPAHESSRTWPKDRLVEAREDQELSFQASLWSTKAPWSRSRWRSAGPLRRSWRRRPREAAVPAAWLVAMHGACSRNGPRTWRSTLTARTGQMRLGTGRGSRCPHDPALPDAGGGRDVGGRAHHAPSRMAAGIRSSRFARSS